MRVDRASLSGARLAVAATAAFALGQGAVAGPTIEFGNGQSLNITYAVQGWLQTKHQRFGGVTSDTTDFFLRRNRLNLLSRIREAGKLIADFSRIEG